MEDMKQNAPVAEKDYILEVDGLKQYFPVAKDFFGKPIAYLRAVDGVSFKLERGKTLGKELEDIQHKAQQELWNEWQNSDEYKQVLAEYRHQAQGLRGCQEDAGW